MLKEREFTIIDIILNQKNVDANILASKFKVSKRTVRYSLLNIRNYFKNENIELHFNKQIGYYFTEYDVKKVVFLISEVREINKVASSQKERCYSIIGKLLMNPNITTKQISRSIFVSATTMHQDLRKVTTLLVENCGILFDFKESIKLTFHEKLIIFFYFSKQENYLSENILNKHVILLFSNFYNESKLMYYYEKVKISRTTYLSNFTIFQTTWLLYFISEIHINVENNVGKFSFVNQSNPLLFDILKTDNIFLTSEEVTETEKYFVSIGWIQPTELIVSKIIDNGVDLLNLIALELNIKIDINSNEVSSLMSHLSALYHRINNNIMYDNIITNKIRIEYPYSYFIAIDFINSLFVEQSNKFYEAEISLIAIYLESIFFPKNPRVNAVLICGSGIAMTNVLKNWVYTHFGTRITVLYYFSNHDIFNQIDYQNVDLIISNLIHNTITDIDIVKVNTLPNHDDLKKIEDKLINIRHESSYLYKVFDNYLFNKEIVEVSFQEVISKACTKFYELGIIKDKQEFQDALLIREKQHSTYFGNYVIVPHPIDIYSSENKIYFAFLKEPIYENGNKIEFIFVLALSEKLNKNVVLIHDFILYFIREESIRKKIRECTTTFEIELIFSRIISVL